MDYIKGVSNLLSSVQFSSYATQIENASMHQPHVTIKYINAHCQIPCQTMIIDNIIQIQITC